MGNAISCDGCCDSKTKHPRASASASVDVSDMEQQINACEKRNEHKPGRRTSTWANTWPRNENKHMRVTVSLFGAAIGEGETSFTIDCEPGDSIRSIKAKAFEQPGVFQKWAREHPGQ